MRGWLSLALVPIALALSLVLDTRLFPIAAALSYLTIWWRLRM